MTGYRSIFLETGWAHTLYYGWQEETALPGIKIWSKRVGPACRRLILSDVTEEEALSNAMRNLRTRHALSETIIHDFTGALEFARSSKLRGFDPLARSRWLLNAATFAIDLARDEVDILARMSADTRRRIRKSDAAKVPVIVERRPDEFRMDRFFEALSGMHRDRGLASVPMKSLDRMFADDRALLLSNESGAAGGAYLMIYLAGDKAIWLHGVGRGTSPDSGQLLQWRAIQSLKARGVRWYDLGGVPADPNSGILRYKRAFGGDPVSLGTEFISSTPLLRLAQQTISVRNRLHR